MPVFLNPRATVPYVLERQRDLPVPDGADDVEKARVAEANGRRQAARVTFQLGVLSALDWAVLMDMVVKNPSQAGTIGLYTIRGGLRGWSGPGAPAFATRGPSDPRPTDETLEHLAVEDRQELADAIEEVNKLSEDDAGKS